MRCLICRRSESLDDHLVDLDVVLGSAASGWNTVEQEGITY